MKISNPILYADFPDPDVIRVGDTFYMVTTTMHMFPGGDILCSKDLVRWEFLCHVYDALPEDTPARRMEEGNIYSAGMWAGTLRFHQGVFHLVFICNDTKSCCHYTAENPAGPWTYRPMEGFCHDASVLFDDDGRVYVVSGNRQIRLTEYEPDLSRPKAGGLDRIIVRDVPEGGLGYEGAHFYKLRGKYYLFLIHWMPTGHGRRTEACFTADSLTGEFTGGDIYDEDMGFRNLGVAQGGIVDTPDGKWYAILFQDHGACGRMPVLVPMSWEGDRPKLDTDIAELDFPEITERPDCPMTGSDDFRGGILRDFWQWNHVPDNTLWRMTPEGLELTAGKPAEDLEKARNTLTQRTTGPVSSYTVTLDGSDLRTGNFAGLCALQGCYAALGLERAEEGLRLTLRSRRGSGQGREEKETVVSQPWEDVSATLRADFDFTGLKDTVCFSVLKNGAWETVGEPHRLLYRLDHFMGVRIGVFCYGTADAAGGKARFVDFHKGK